MFGTAESASLIYYVQADLSSTFFQNSQYFLRYPGSHILAEDLHGKMTVVIGGWARDVEDAVPYGMKYPLFLLKQGISKSCSSQYAERIIATGQAVLPD